MNRTSTGKIVAWLVLAVILVAAAVMTIIPLTISLIISVLALLAVLPRDFVKNWRLLLWVFFIVISLYFIAPSINPDGLAVKSIDKNSTITGISQGDILYKINDQKISLDMLQNTYDGTIKIETSRGIKFVRANGTLGIAAESVQPTNLKFGLDLKGGIRAVLEPETTDNATLEQVISTLQTRINVYGLREAIFRPEYYAGKGFVEVSIAGGTKEELTGLLENQGKFEAKIPLKLRVIGGVSSLTLGKTYQLYVVNKSVVLDNKTYAIGDSFSLDGIDFALSDVKTDSINLTSTVFTGKDIITVFFDPQRSRIDNTGTDFKWSFAVQLSGSGAQRFAYVTANTNSLPGGYLDTTIDFYLDSMRLDSLTIASSLRGKAETEISITGSAGTMDNAIKERNRLQSILRSGALPTKVQIVQLDSVSPTLGAGFLSNAALAGLAAVIGVILVVSVRYRKPRLVVPMILISMSEVMIVLGIAVLIGWTVDLAAIAGLIASVGTGIDSQIIILDRTLRKEEEQIETLKEKLKKAFFVVFGSGGTVIAAMLPLMILGFGTLRGFAIVTIIGVLVGVFIARPAYGAILERMKKD